MVLMPQFTTTSARWAALQSRDPKSASAFVYCVTTTKIYCRPTCPSRLARRANIVFHDTAPEAAAEGFRACKRCRPELGDGEGDPQKIAVEKACDLIRKEQSGGKDGKWGVKALAREVGLTESHFCRIFRKVMGMTVGAYRNCISLVPKSGILETSDMAQRHEAAILSNSQASFASVLPETFGEEHWFDATVLEDRVLEQEWHCFGGVPSSLAGRPGPDLPPMYFNLAESDHSSLDSFFDLSKPDIMDDGFQFLDFESLPSSQHLR